MPESICLAWRRSFGGDVEDPRVLRDSKGRLAHDIDDTETAREDDLELRNLGPTQGDVLLTFTLGGPYRKNRL